MNQTVDSGLASGTPRTMNRKGVREGREQELGFRPTIHGVVRRGKAMAVKSVDDEEGRDEDEKSQRA